MIELKIEKYNHKGYGVAHQDGKEFWILNAIPGETVQAEIIKKKKGIRIGKSISIIKKSPTRVKPRDQDLYQSTSPWQILDFKEENLQKQSLIRSFYKESSLELPKFEVKSNNQEWNYRNKMEYSFYIDDDDFIHLSFHKRDSRRGKVIVDTSSLVDDVFNKTAKEFEKFLNNSELKYSQLKAVVVRTSMYESKAIVALAIKDEKADIDSDLWQEFLDVSGAKGIIFIYSDPRSPAFVETGILKQLGITDLVEKIRDRSFQYSYSGFFQVNPPMFDHILNEMESLIDKYSLSGDLLDIYAGVGSIGLSLSDHFDNVVGVELHPQSEEYAIMNAKSNKIQNYSFIQGYAEKVIAESEFESKSVILLDPPRSGLHPKVTKALNENGAENVLYMSCNPYTQAKDIALMQENYEILEFEAFNFYPKTPHVESLAYLKRTT